MWISLFSIVLALALGLALGAMVLESYEEEHRRGSKTVRSLRSVRQM